MFCKLPLPVAAAAISKEIRGMPSRIRSCCWSELLVLPIGWKSTAAKLPSLLVMQFFWAWSQGTRTGLRMVRCGVELRNRAYSDSCGEGYWKRLSKANSGKAAPSAAPNIGPGRLIPGTGAAGRGSPFARWSGVAAQDVQGSYISGRLSLETTFSPLQHCFPIDVDWCCCL
eukprot:symbB.v1.2.023776.t1/scaffold2200.1/size85926/3